MGKFNVIFEDLKILGCGMVGIFNADNFSEAQSLAQKKVDKEKELGNLFKIKSIKPAK